MGVLEAIILGIVQGLAEFLPISSSGHIELGKAVLGTDLEGDKSLFFTLMLHVATALSTIIVFRKDIGKLVKGMIAKSQEDLRYALYIILSMIPAGLVGFLFKDELESLFSGEIIMVGCLLILTGVILLASQKQKQADKDVDWKSAIIIGVSQAIAILPGISRSGSTIGTGLILGIDREKMARFSFLMVLPLIFGSMLKDAMDLKDQSSALDLEILPLALGFISAFITGVLACKWMIKLVKSSKLSYFAYYCFAVGSFAVIYTLIQNG